MCLYIKQTCLYTVQSYNRLSFYVYRWFDNMPFIVLKLVFDHYKYGTLFFFSFQN